MAQWHLIPAPRSLTPGNGAFSFPQDLHIVLQNHPATRQLPCNFLSSATQLSGSRFHLSIGEGVDPACEIRVRFDDSIVALPAVRDQAYRLSITPDGITIAAQGAPGIFYAFQTLLQIIRETAFKNAHNKSPINRKAKNKNRKSLALPCLTILDFPDFPKRGVYHDTARGKVPTLGTLLQLIDDLAHLKYNEFQLYVENNFQFRKFPEMHDDTTPLTAEELLILDQACRARHIDFVPSLTSLGHFEKILSRPAFRHLAEAEPAQLKALNATCWCETAPWSLCVTDPYARTFLKDMYAEFAPNFSSPQFNICCDEAYDLGQVRSKAAAEKAGGTGQLYVEWINYCNTLAKSHGKSIQMWGDIILHHPDLISQLPEDAVLLEWGYEHDHKFDEHCTTFAQRLGGASRSFYVSPGTSSWLTLSARTKNAFGNIHSAAAAGLKHGATGLLVTDWGDNGHQQMLSCSLTQFAYGAAASWNLASTPNPCNQSKIENQKSKIATHLRAISLHLFQDPTALFAALAYDLGLTYERFSWQRFNASIDWYLFREKWDFANYVNRAQPKDLPKVIAACEKLRAQFSAATLRHDDADQIKAEMIFTCDEVIHTCQRTALRQAWLAADPAKRNPEEETLRIKPPKPLSKTFKPQMTALRKDALKLHDRFATLWLTRNKRSRLDDVLTEFKRLADEYTRFSK